MSKTIKVNKLDYKPLLTETRELDLCGTKVEIRRYISVEETQKVYEKARDIVLADGGKRPWLCSLACAAMVMEACSPLSFTRRHGEIDWDEVAAVVEMIEQQDYEWYFNFAQVKSWVSRDLDIMLRRSKIDDLAEAFTAMINQQQQDMENVDIKQLYQQLANMPSLTTEDLVSAIVSNMRQNS